MEQGFTRVMASLLSNHDWSFWMCGEKFDLGSLCIQRSLIDTINIFFLLFYSLSLVITACKRNYSHTRVNSNRKFLISSLCCAIIAIANFGFGIWTLSRVNQTLWNWLVCFLRGIIWAFLAFSLLIQPNKFVKNLSIIWWVSFSVLSFVFNLETLIRSNNSIQVLDFLSWPVTLSLFLCSFKLYNSSISHITDNLSEPLLSHQNENKIEYSRAGFFSRLTFRWMNPLLCLGYSRPLDLSDIPSLDSEDGALQACQIFIKQWAHFTEQDTAKTSQNMVFLVLARCYMKEILITGLYAFLRTLAFACSPVLLFSFVSYSYTEDRDPYTGVLLIICLIVMKLVESLSQRHWFFGSRRLGMKMRSALMGSIFQKQLNLSNQGRKNHSTGEIVNYVAIDAYRLGEFPFWLHLGWTQPLQLFLAIALLFWTVEIGTLPGLIPLIVCGIINIPFAKFLQHYQSKFMEAQDERQRATSEVLNNIKIIKLQSWEEKFREKIQSLRETEVKWLGETQIKKAYGSALFWMSPTIISAVIFAGTAILGSAPLNASTVFTILASLRVISEPMRMLPEALSVLIQVKVSLDRIAGFLTEDEFKTGDVNRVNLPSSDISVNLCNGVFNWEISSASNPTIKGIDLSVKRGEKIAVCGPVGAGKSSLLSALLGEIPKISGSLDIYGSIAYVSQTSWIQSGTIQDNILFGKPMNRERYERAIKSCALDKDIENFDHGDETEIGQRGLNMSGGQKQRIQLARAVYSDADIYLLDDPFSAVDAHTAAILFHDCVMSALEKKTVILVTHQVEFLAKVDRILVMENGQVTQDGNYNSLLQSGTPFEQLVNAHKSSINALDSQNHKSKHKKCEEETTNQSHEPLKKERNKPESSPKQAILPPSVQLTEAEQRESGELGLKPYKDYFSVSNGWFLLVLIILTQCAFVILQCLATYWLAVAVQERRSGTGVAVGVYAAMATASCLFAYVRSLVAANLGLKASRAFFSGFMDSVFRAPMLFFDSTPSGRIMTRAATDLSTLDFDIPYTLTFVLSGTIEVTATIIIMITVTWQVVIIAIPALLLLLYIQRYYIATARELVRINGTTKAPVMNYAAESMLGAVTIRAFNMVHQFIRTNFKLIDTDAKLFFHTNAALEWVLLRVESIQILIIITSALFLLLLPYGVVSPGFMGLCLSYALTLSSAQVFLTRFYSNLENYIISVERIKQFMHICKEPPAIINNCRPPPSWPSHGRIDLQNLKVKYRPNAPYVLKGITCTFNEGNKIGVVGRTGSGKTTLLSSLFRLVDPADGRILIDNLDICTIGLKDLRMKLSIIPQEPTLFRGNVRTNLDPLGLHTDDEIWEALEKCQLKKTIRTLPALLDSPVSDEGENWSAGQRQLFCLGRVLLRKNRVLVLDEATASIDSATDSVLQRVIKQEFSGCTVVTIAHRVPTVTDSDMVMVLSYGELVEYDNPANLTANKDSAFARLVSEYWSNYT